MSSFLVYVAAAVLEIGGCHALWLWAREGRPWPLIVVGIASLAAFGRILAFVDSAAAGRAFAAYGGVYIASALLWMWAAEGVRPDRTDMVGAAFCLVGAAIILFGPHRAA